MMSLLNLIENIYLYIAALIHFFETPLGLVLGVSLLFLSFYLWIRLQCRKKVIRILEGVGGRIQLSRQALEALVLALCQQEGVIGRPKIDFLIKNKKLDISIQIKFSLAQPLAMHAETLQSKIIHLLHSHLGSEFIGGVHLLIVGFDQKEGDATSPLMDSL